MKWFAAVFTSLLYVAGYNHGTWYGYLLGVLCVIALGAMFAHAERGFAVEKIASATDHPLELGSITMWAHVNSLMPLYVLVGGGYTPVVSAFICRLDGQRAIVLETP